MSDKQRNALVDQSQVVQKSIVALAFPGYVVFELGKAVVGCTSEAREETLKIWWLSQKQTPAIIRRTRAGSASSIRLFIA